MKSVACSKLPLLSCELLDPENAVNIMLTYHAILTLRFCGTDNPDNAKQLLESGVATSPAECRAFLDLLKSRLKEAGEKERGGGPGGGGNHLGGYEIGRTIGGPLGASDPAGTPLRGSGAVPIPSFPVGTPGPVSRPGASQAGAPAPIYYTAPPRNHAPPPPQRYLPSGPDNCGHGPGAACR
jgi:hypothetical protein